MNGQRRPSSPRSSTSSRPPRGIVAQHISDKIKAAIKSTTAGISESLVQVVRFLPKGDLHTILDLPILRSYLRELFSDIVESRQALEEEILAGGGHEPTGLDELIDNAMTLITGDPARGIPPRRALLALFLYQRRTGLLAIFESWLLSRRTDFPSDDDLPFSQQSLEKAGIPDRYHDYFNDYQSIFAPVVLREGQDQTFTSKDRLPYVGAHLEEQEGSSGIVYTRKVAPCHWEVQLPNGDYTPAETLSPTILALKVFTSGRPGQDARPDFEIERDILKDLRNSNFAHKMILLDWGSITIQDEQGPPIEHSLIFECATCSLEEFLMGEKSVETSWTARLLLAKLADIVQALACLHDDFDTLHLDIKPDNILVFEKASTNDSGFEWKISDFGLARKRTAKPRAGHMLDLNRSTSKSASLLATRNAGEYQAPEIQQRNASKAGRKSDVWSMGCVALMVLGFAIKGSEGVTDLANGLQVEHENAAGVNRSFYVTNDSYQWRYVAEWGYYEYQYLKEHKPSSGSVPDMQRLEAAVHPHVVEWSNKLYRYCHDRPEQPFLKLSLETIFTRVLLIDMSARIKAGQFYKYLIGIQENWKQKEERNVNGENQIVPSIGIPAHHPESRPLAPKGPQQPISVPEETTTDPTEGDITAGLDTSQVSDPSKHSKLCAAIVQMTSASVPGRLELKSEIQNELQKDSELVRRPCPRSNCQRHPIHVAIRNKSYEALELLLDAAVLSDLSIPCPGCGNRTAVEEACESPGDAQALNLFKRYLSGFSVTKEFYLSYKNRVGRWAGEALKKLSKTPVQKESIIHRIFS